MKANGEGSTADGRKETQECLTADEGEEKTSTANRRE